MSTRSLIARIIDDFRTTDPAGQSEEAIPWLLHALVVAVRPKVIVEIGAFRGFSSMAMAAGLQLNETEPPSENLVEFNRISHPAPGLLSGHGTLYCIDPVKHEYFVRASEKFGLSRYIHFIESRSDDVKLDAIPTIDLLFIDGLHSYAAVVRDFERFSAKVRPGGLILIHDVFPDATRHTDTSKAWWGPNLFVRQLREGVEFGDLLLLDTQFPSVAIFRKNVAHVDYPFLTIKGLLPAVVQFMWRRMLNAPRELPLAIVLRLAGGRTTTRRWKILRALARRLGVAPRSQQSSG